ncbi:MAG: PKD domain-containing protein, partial [bacterium]
MLTKRARTASIVVFVLMLAFVDCGDDSPTGPLNTAPTASFTVSSGSGTTETVFQFDASGCSDAEDAASALQVRWDWEDDGTWDTGWSTTKTATYQYGTAGTKTVRLEVKDTGSLSDDTTQAVQVSVPNTAPTASFTVTPSEGTTLTEFQFDASGSSDAEDAPSALQVRWDWEDDGTWDADWSTTKTATHQYGSVGTKTARLEVKDTGGLSDDTTQVVVVTVANTAPVASFTVTPSEGTTLTEFQFDASGSSDAEDAPSTLQVRWDWEDDGIWDAGWSTTRTITHQYGEAGTKTVRLEVRDTGGLSDDTTQVVTVSGPNTPPTATFWVMPGSGTTATVFLFDASGSSDAEDGKSVLEVRWDWEDDGTWDADWSTHKGNSHQYGEAGAKTVRLQVRDTGGLSDDTTRVVTVSADNTAPTASFTLDAGRRTPGTVIQVDASGSSDAEDPGSLLQVRWTWEGDWVWTDWTTTK